MVYAPDRVESIAPISVAEKEHRGSGRIQATAQLELETYLEDQVRSIAPAKIDSLSLVDGYTYLSVMDEDRPTTQPMRLIIQLEDGQDNERLVDLVTNNDRFAFITRIIRNHFDSCWKISDTWVPKDGCPF
jgi:hypothetical protein